MLLATPKIYTGLRVCCNEVLWYVTPCQFGEYLPTFRIHSLIDILLCVVVSDWKYLDRRVTQCHFVHPLMKPGLNGKALASDLVTRSTM